MKKIAILGSVALLNLASCAFKTPEENPIQGNTGNPKETKPFASHYPPLETLAFGPWQGTIPCADCPGIVYQLTLQKDRTYEESSEYLEKTATPFKEKGTWLITQDSIVTLAKPAGKTQFRFTKGGLYMLDQQGQLITSALAENYRLSRPSGGATSTSNNLETKRKQGIDFVATGNESPWTLDLDMDKAITFINPGEKIKLTALEPSEQKIPGGKGMVYRAKTEAGTLTVRVLNQACTDKKTGKQLPYTVEVTANAQDYSGCGQFLEDDNPLNGNWTLSQINGSPVNATDFQGGAPSLYLQKTTRQATGNGGCNRFSGNLEVKGDQLIFGLLASTRMACPDPAMSFENNYLKLLSEKTYTYSLDANTLRLKTNGQIVFVYRKTQ